MSKSAVSGSDWLLPLVRSAGEAASDPKRTVRLVRLGQDESSTV
jgi:hypothetical protein